MSSIQFHKSVFGKQDSLTGHVKWQSPSNIALVKYWGKYGRQLPRNTSISFTLSKAFTNTSINYEVSEYESDSASLEFYFEGKPNEAFAHRIKRFLDSIIDEMPMLRKLHLSIESDNSFPHSSGIASSASSMSALALCLCTIEQQLYQIEMSQADFLGKASYLSRLGSGSACRSIYPNVGLWGKHEKIKNSSLDFAVEIKEINDVFKSFHDDILIVSPHEKSVSSSQGHQLMEENPYATARYTQAEDHITKVLNHLRTGEIFELGEIIESEALTLHALMMCSTPSYMLMLPETLRIIEKVRQYRQESKRALFFTLDAGPNVHLLYPDHDKDHIQSFIKSELLQHCHDARIIEDMVGPGSIKL